MGGFLVCDHIKDNGVRCGSPAMLGRKFCFYHLRYYDPTQIPGSGAYRQPILDTHQAIQIMITQVQRAYLAKAIDDRQMTNLLYSLQLAHGNLKELQTPRGDYMCTAMTSGMMDALQLAPGEFEVDDDVPYNMLPVPKTPEEAVQLAREILIEASPEFAKALQKPEEERRETENQQAIDHGN